MKFAIISTSISPRGNFVNNTLHGTFDNRDHAVAGFNGQVEKEMPHWSKSTDIGARTILSEENGARLIIEILVSTHIDDKQG